VENLCKCIDTELSEHNESVLNTLQLFHTKDLTVFRYGQLNMKYIPIYNQVNVNADVKDST